MFLLLFSFSESCWFFFFNYAATPEIYTYGHTLSLHDALPICEGVGGTDACIALACDYANQRQAFGQAIGKFQAVKHGIAEMYVLNEMARASVLDAAVRLENADSDADAYIGAARLNAVQAYETAAAAATQVHGGIGVTWEAVLPLHHRRSRALAAATGLWTGELQIPGGQAGHLSVYVPPRNGPGFRARCRREPRECQRRRGCLYRRRPAQRGAGL